MERPDLVAAAQKISPPTRRGCLSMFVCKTNVLGAQDRFFRFAPPVTQSAQAGLRAVKDRLPGPRYNGKLT